MMRIVPTFAKAVPTQIQSGSAAPKTPAARPGEADTFVQVEATQNKAKERIIQAGQKIFDQLAILEEQERQNGTKKTLNRSAELTHTSNNSKLSHPNRILLLRLMKEVFKEDESLSIVEFRKRLEAVILEKTDHFLGFEF